MHKQTLVPWLITLSVNTETSLTFTHVFSIFLDTYSISQMNGQLSFIQLHFEKVRKSLEHS